MAQLIPVDHDPFDMAASLAAAGGDPLVPPPRNPAMPADWAQNAVRRVGGGLADILMAPRRAMDQGMTTAEAVPWAGDMALNMAGAGGLGAAAGALGAAGGKLVQPAGIRAYHGSPHDFDRFDLSKIGTGEGAQSYGHGLYFAENERVARQYRDDLAGMRRSSASSALNRNPDLDAAIAETQQRIAHYKSMPAANLDTARRDSLLSINQQKLEDLLNLQRGQGLPEGRMYEVNINAKPEQFLDWDRPLAQQTAPVLPAMERFGLGPRDPGGADALRGDQIYALLGDKLTRSGHGMKRQYNENATAALREAGIPGIKYLDQGSRKIVDLEKIIDQSMSPDRVRLAKQELEQLSPSSNYVVFDDKIIDILHKYGIGGLSMLPPAVAAHVQSRLIPVDHDPFAQ